MKPPKSIPSMDGIAGLINQEYGERLGLSCDRFLISKWRRAKQVPPGVGPFPAPNNRNSFEVGPCFQWVEKYIAAKSSAPVIESVEAKAEASARRERARANREQRLDAKEAGLLIERAVAEIDAIGIVQRLHNSCTLQDEQEIPNFCAETLRNLNLQPETTSIFIARLTEKMQTVTARRVAMFKESTEEFLKGQI